MNSLNLLLSYEMQDMTTPKFHVRLSTMTEEKKSQLLRFVLPLEWCNTKVWQSFQERNERLPFVSHRLVCIVSTSQLHAICSLEAPQRKSPMFCCTSRATAAESARERETRGTRLCESRKCLKTRVPDAAQLSVGLFRTVIKAIVGSVS